ncbi:hypothetical protein [Hyalangium rubrum]|uniref:Outer membrane protein beta-barrel domain-containing protein n=1 Tax=Hyalangium rubrum TaxID=3103134 RepID=A0ABU5H7X9_9BACT|nr:hypothetical protein [Hyalangium sp. s54d21]MDY7229565.1 hypothetical protein [Hyalangium sp. s54d21]
MRHLLMLVVLLPWFSAEAEEWEARRRRSGRYESQSNWRHVAPTLGLHLGSVVLSDYHLVPSEEQVGIGGVWLGLAFHPSPRRASPFVAFGTELNVVGNSFEGTFFEGVPQLRAGIALMNEDGVFPIDLELYGLGGYRFGNGLRPGTVRVGAGLSIPAFAVAQYQAYKIPFIPWMVEVFYDMSRQQEVGFRVGYHF